MTQNIGAPITLPRIETERPTGRRYRIVKQRVTRGGRFAHFDKVTGWEHYNLFKQYVD